MTTKSITTKEGKTIKVEMVREVVDDVAYADGHRVKTGRKIVQYTSIYIIDAASGKVLARGERLYNLNPKTDAKMIAKGAVAQLAPGVYLKSEMRDIISSLLAEVEAETPKSAEQIEIETAKARAEAAYDKWAKSPERVADRKFEREMYRADSDY